jgi:hypothetical protein
MVGVSEGIATLQMNRPAVSTAKSVMQSKILHGLLSLLRIIISPVFSFQKYELFECDDLRSLPSIQNFPNVNIETYDGSLGIPDDVAEIIKPRAGEALSVIFIARKVVGYIRAAFKDMNAPECDVLVNVRAGHVYLFELSVRNEYRGTELSRQLLLSATRAFHEQGFNNVIFGRILNGVQSRFDMERNGFKSYLKIAAYKILGQRINVITRKN